MKLKLNSIAVVTAALVAFASAGFSDDKKAAVNDHDMKFIKEVAAAGKTEVKVGELAVKKAQRADVKAFAEQLVADHTAMNNDLQGLADKKSVDISAVIPPSGASEFQKLEGYSGKDFDNEFLKKMESDHKDTISKFESEQKKVEDSDLKAFVDKGLSGLKDHLSKVQGLLGENK